VSKEPVSKIETGWVEWGSSRLVLLSTKWGHGSCLAWAFVSAKKSSFIFFELLLFDIQRLNIIL
jgi:hypothetical protein